MPYETIREKQGVYQRFSGLLTRKDRERANHVVMGDRRFDAMDYWIVDSLAIEEYQLEKKDAEIAALRSQ